MPLILPTELEPITKLSLKIRFCALEPEILKTVPPAPDAVSETPRILPPVVPVKRTPPARTSLSSLVSLPVM